MVLLSTYSISLILMLNEEIVCASKFKTRCFSFEEKFCNKIKNP